MKLYDTDLTVAIRSESTIREALSKDGVAIVRNVFDREDVEKPKSDLLSAFHFFTGDPNSDFNSRYQHFWLTKPEVAEHSLSLARDLPSFINLVAGEKIRTLMRRIFDSQDLICPFDWCLFRVDGPSTKKSRFEWHQDYPYNVISTAAVTFWIALSDMDENMGLLKFVPGSHFRIHPVQVDENPQHNNPNRLRIADLEIMRPEWERHAVATGPMKAGDVVVFNSLLLHRSGLNKSQKYRWVANGRYARADDPELIARNFHTARLKYPYFFKAAHPNLVVD